MQITLATPSDIPSLCTLLHLLFSQEVEFTPDAVAQSRGLALIINNPHTGHILLAREGDTVAGMVNLLYTVSTALGARVGLLEDMMVAPAFRNSGIGSQLLQHAIAHARQQGCQRITQTRQVARTGVAQANSSEDPFDIANFFQLRL